MGLDVSMDSKVGLHLKTPLDLAYKIVKSSIAVNKEDNSPASASSTM